MKELNNKIHKNTLIHTQNKNVDEMIKREIFLKIIIIMMKKMGTKKTPTEKFIKIDLKI